MRIDGTTAVWKTSVGMIGKKFAAKTEGKIAVTIMIAATIGAEIAAGMVELPGTSN